MGWADPDRWKYRRRKGPRLEGKADVFSLKLGWRMVQDERGK